MPRSLPRVVASLFALAALLLPSLASACPVCGQGAPGTESAILVMSGILSALPLLMAGGILVWVLSRVRAAAAADDSARPDGVDAAERPLAAQDTPVLATMKAASTSEVR